MACERSVDGCPGRFQVSDFAEQNHVGVRAHESGQRFEQSAFALSVGDRLGDYIELADAEDGILRGVFQRVIVFCRNVLSQGLHDVFEDGGLAVSGGTGDDGETGSFREGIDEVLLFRSEAERCQTLRYRSRGGRCVVEQTHGEGYAG